MFRSARFYIKMIGSIILLTPTMNKAKKNMEIGEKSAADAYVNRFVKRWAKNRVKDSGATVTVHGYENIPQEGNMLFVSNHLSNFDFMVMLAEIPMPIGFVAKIELKKIPLLRTWMELIHCTFMDREDMKQQLKTILEGIGLLKEGYNLVVFPEGTRSKTGEMADFKAGSFKLATKAKVPIVPLTIVGSADVMENNKNNKIVPAKVELYIHKPIFVTDMEKEELGKIHETVQSIVSEPLKKL